MLAIDTNVMIWGVKRVASPDRMHMIPKATAFFERCQRERTKVIIPSPVLAEYLVDLDAPAREASLALFQKHFFVAPFDARAALIASEIQSHRDVIGRIKADYGVPHQCVKADVMIVATAIAAKASKLIAEDKHMRTLGLAKIIVEGLPDVQMELLK